SLFSRAAIARRSERRSSSACRSTASKTSTLWPAIAISRPPSAEPHARVDDRVDEVDEQVEDDVDRGHHQDEALDRVEVVRRDRAVGVLADSRPREDRLDDDVAREEVAEHDPEHRQERDE